MIHLCSVAFALLYSRVLYRPATHMLSALMASARERASVAIDVPACPEQGASQQRALSPLPEAESEQPCHIHNGGQADAQATDARVLDSEDSDDQRDRQRQGEHEAGYANNHEAFERAQKAHASFGSGALRAVVFGFSGASLCTLTNCIVVA